MWGEAPIVPGEIFETFASYIEGKIPKLVRKKRSTGSSFPVRAPVILLSMSVPKCSVDCPREPARREWHPENARLLWMLRLPRTTLEDSSTPCVGGAQFLIFGRGGRVHEARCSCGMTSPSAETPPGFTSPTRPDHAGVFTCFGRFFSTTKRATTLVECTHTVSATCTDSMANETAVFAMVDC